MILIEASGLAWSFIVLSTFAGGMYDIVLAFMTAFLLVFLAIPSIINIARVKHLYDVPDQRKSHTEAVPTLGGVAIFAGVIFLVAL